MVEVERGLIPRLHRGSSCGPVSRSRSRAWNSASACRALVSAGLPIQGTSDPHPAERVTIGGPERGQCNKRNFVLQEIQFLVLRRSGFLPVQQDHHRRLISQVRRRRTSAPGAGGEDGDGILLMDKEFRVTLINPAGRPPRSLTSSRRGSSLTSSASWSSR
jgi:hypothetical protein